MKCYTIQRISAWEEAKKKGYLTGNRDHIDEDWFLTSYTWMMEQMTKRIKGYTGEFPVWLWLDTSNICFEELLQDEWVLLEVEINEERVLFSNFDAWHFVLNNFHFDEEDNSITKEQSWEYIFDKDKLESFGYGFDKDDLQGVVERIDCSNIKVLKYILNETNNT